VRFDVPSEPGTVDELLVAAGPVADELAFIAVRASDVPLQVSFAKERLGAIGIDTGERTLIGMSADVLSEPPRPGEGCCALVVGTCVALRTTSLRGLGW